jgi:hypothetical protein
MPVRRYKQNTTTEHETLAADLASEWLMLDSNNSEPVIVEETGVDGALAHVYVVWGRWSHMDMTERSEIIMEAARTILKPEQVDDITLAMGLIPEEADRLRIAWRS